MPGPGWYPDPAGTQGSFRYWDGNQWSEQTTNNPGDTPPPQGPGNASGGAGGRGWIWAIVAVLVAVAVVIGLVYFSMRGNGEIDVPEDTNTSTPTAPVWDETSTPTPTPSSSQSLQACPVTTVSDTTSQSRGYLSGGGLQMPVISGWGTDNSFYLDWVSDLHTATDQVYTGWIANQSVGALNTVDGFTDIRTAAHQTMECFASTGYYNGYTGRSDLVDEEYSVDNHQAWHMRAEVYVSLSYLPQVQGDTVDIIVVDIGSPDRLGVMLSSVNIGDDARQSKMDEAIGELKVVQ